MQSDPRTFLSDAAVAADAIVEFTRGKPFDDYVAEPILQSAVERQFVIIGEALTQLAWLDPGLAGKIRDLPRIVAFRKSLVHGSRSSITMWCGAPCNCAWRSCAPF